MRDGIFPHHIFTFLKTNMVTPSCYRPETVFSLVIFLHVLTLTWSPKFLQTRDGVFHIFTFQSPPVLKVNVVFLWGIQSLFFRLFYRFLLLCSQSPVLQTQTGKCNSHPYSWSHISNFEKGILSGLSLVRHLCKSVQKIVHKTFSHFFSVNLRYWYLQNLYSGNLEK